MIEKKKFRGYVEKNTELGGIKFHKRISWKCL